MLKSNLANDASDKESAKLALWGCRAVCNLASGFFPSDREKVSYANCAVFFITDAVFFNLSELFATVLYFITS